MVMNFARKRKRTRSPTLFLFPTRWMKQPGFRSDVLRRTRRQSLNLKIESKERNPLSASLLLVCKWSPPRNKLSGSLWSEIMFALTRVNSFAGSTKTFFLSQSSRDGSACQSDMCVKSGRACDSNFTRVFNFCTLYCVKYLNAYKFFQMFYNKCEQMQKENYYWNADSND